MQLVILLAIASVEYGLARRLKPEIQIIPTGLIPQICVTADRELPPCGIGKFKKTQHDYEEKIERIRQSYVDMIIDFKDTKDVSFENFGPSRVYLESFESLERRLQGEEADVNSSRIKNPNIDSKSTTNMVRVIRSLKKTVITATECIPLGVEFCDNFPRPSVDQDTEISQIQKRSLPSVPEFFSDFWNPESKEKNQHESGGEEEGFVEIVPQNREDFFRRVDKRSISEDLNRVDIEKVNYGILYEIISPRNIQFSEPKKNVDQVTKPETDIRSMDLLTVHKKLEVIEKN